MDAPDEPVYTRGPKYEYRGCHTLTATVIDALDRANGSATRRMLTSIMEHKLAWARAAVSITGDREPNLALFWCRDYLSSPEVILFYLVRDGILACH